MNTLMVGPDREELKKEITGAEHGQTLEFEVDSIGEPLQITTYGFRVKRFPNCGSAHRAMDILLDIMEIHSVKASDITRIEVYAPKTHLDNLFYHKPATALEAKFSMEYALACLLETGYCKLQDFSDDVIRSPDRQKHFEKIILHPIDRLESVCPTRLLVHCKDNSSFELSASMPKGSISSPFTTQQYWEKFDACIDGLLTVEAGNALKQALRNFPDLDASREMTRHYGIDLPD
jgi:2-methylcitrate dehydratase PrpD